MRLSQHARELSRRFRVHAEQLVQPLFVVEGLTERENVDGLVDVYRDTPSSLLRQIETDLSCGINKFLLFGVPRDKQEKNFTYRFTTSQIASIKKEFGQDLWLAADVCLCAQTSHGHCGVLNDERDYVDNAASVAELARAALEYAQAGTDCVAPSDMMDGRVAAIRTALDEADREQTIIMSYAAKFQSNFYGPFRQAAESTPRGSGVLTDRASYQLDPGRADDARRSAVRDAREGADILMVKPALPYLDILTKLSAAIDQPWAVYQTSGEQAGIDLSAAAGLLDAARAQTETWTACLRAGASMIISYAARRANL